MSQRVSISSVIHLLVTSVLTVAVLALTFIVVKHSAERAAEKAHKDETETPNKGTAKSQSGEDQEPQLLTIVDQNIKPINFD